MTLYNQSINTTYLLQQWSGSCLRAHQSQICARHGAPCRWRIHGHQTLRRLGRLHFKDEQLLHRLHLRPRQKNRPRRMSLQFALLGFLRPPRRPLRLKSSDQHDGELLEKTPRTRARKNQKRGAPISRRPRFEVRLATAF